MSKPHGFTIEASDSEEEDDVLAFYEDGVKLWSAHLDLDADKLRFAIKALVRWQARDMSGLLSLLGVPPIKGYVVYLKASEGNPLRIAYNTIRGWVVETSATVFQTRVDAVRHAESLQPTECEVQGVR
jgi:hypothetical protein